MLYSVIGVLKCPGGDGGGGGEVLAGHLGLSWWRSWMNWHGWNGVVRHTEE